mmetsp:Transcript_31502/g.59222  ORF Transcript_31502/g.59222 Transcript_31502/m.59222 type:complete len:292 (-) Transcript_31502:287-1162(-)
MHAALCARGRWAGLALLTKRLDVDVDIGVVEEQDSPIQNNHLAVCDERSLVHPDDYIPTDLHLSEIATKQVYHLNHTNHKQHKWYYFPAMNMGEILLFKNWDSDRSSPARMCFHTAFSDPNAVPNAKARQSIEARGYAYFPDHEPDTCSWLVKPCMDVPVPEAVSKVMHAIEAFDKWMPTAQQWAKNLMDRGAVEEIAQTLVRDERGTIGLAATSPENKRAVVLALLRKPEFTSLLSKVTANVLEPADAAPARSSKEAGQALRFSTSDVLLATAAGAGLGAVIVYALTSSR